MRDKKRKLLFAALQSAAGQKAIAEAVSQGLRADSVLLFYRGRYYNKSSAALRALMLLGGFWKLSVVAFLFPAFLRNLMYDWIARNRYRWFGKQDACMMPTSDLRSRFIE